MPRVNENSFLSGKAAERHLDLNMMLVEFQGLFPYETENDRAIAIVGGTFLDTLLEHILFAFLPENEKDVEKLMEANQPLGNFSNKITMCYCLGLIDKVIKSDLNIVRKIRNRFAHDLYVSFEDEQIKSWCNELKWHKHSLMMNPPAEATSQDLFQVGVNQLISHLSGCVGIARNEKRTIRDNYKF